MAHEIDTYWEDAKGRINDDLEKVNQIFLLTNSIWVGGASSEFIQLISEANRINGVMMGILTRQLAEADYFRDNPPPKP